MPDDEFEDDDLSDLIKGENRKLTARKAPKGFVSAMDRPLYAEECEACGGTGRWHRRICFRCKGEGKRVFKTPPEARAKSRARAAQKAIQREADKVAWRTAHAAEVLWCARARRLNEARGGTFDFPAKLLEALEQYGTWTDGQLAAVQRLMERDRR